MNDFMIIGILGGISIIGAIVISLAIIKNGMVKCPKIIRALLMLELISVTLFTLYGVGSAILEILK